MAGSEEVQMDRKYTSKVEAKALRDLGLLGSTTTALQVKYLRNMSVAE